ncbi:MAG: sulfurtransferase, partial [Acidobacteria bacterium]|nr:sulfurtransferase [Acidobacteriota bacterium]
PYSRLVSEAKAQIRETTPEEVRARRERGESPVLVDVREDDEYREDHAAGALHLSRGILEREIGKAIPDAGTPVVVYCGSGSRSALAADTLCRMGYTQVASLKGGIARWRELGLPLETGTKA